MAKQTQSQQRYGKSIKEILSTAQNIDNTLQQGGQPNSNQLDKILRLAEGLRNEGNRYEHARRKPEMSVIVSDPRTADLLKIARRYDTVFSLITQASMRGSYPEKRLSDVNNRMQTAVSQLDNVVRKCQRLVRNAKTPNRPKSNKKTATNGAAAPVTEKTTTKAATAKKKVAKKKAKVKKKVAAKKAAAKVTPTVAASA